MSTLACIFNFNLIYLFVSRHEVHSRNQWCARVIFVESESRALRVRVIWNFVESSRSRVTRMAESLRV